MKVVMGALVLFSFFSLASGLPVPSKCLKDMEIDHYCANRKMYACLPDRNGILHPVCRHDVINKTVNIIYYLGDGVSIHAHEEKISLPVTEDLYTKISSIIIGYNNGRKNNLLQDKVPIACNLSKEELTTIPCLPKPWTCTLGKNVGLSPRQAKVDLVLYNDPDKPLLTENMKLPSTIDYDYSYFAKLLCAYQTCNDVINKYNLHSVLDSKCNEKYKLHPEQDKECNKTCPPVADETCPSAVVIYVGVFLAGFVLAFIVILREIRLKRPSTARESQAAKYSIVIQESSEIPGNIIPSGK